MLSQVMPAEQLFCEILALVLCALNKYVTFIWSVDSHTAGGDMIQLREDVTYCINHLLQTAATPSNHDCLTSDLSGQDMHIYRELGQESIPIGQSKKKKKNLHGHCKILQIPTRPDQAKIC